MTKDNKIIYPWEFVKSPNFWSGRKTPCTVLVYHYTAGGSIDNCVKYFQKKNGVSAHFVIERDGRVVQMVDLCDRSWHAGTSSWKGKNGVNNFSVGIEICNWGPLKRKGDKYYCWPNKYNYEYKGEEPFEDSRGNYWEKYPEQQIQALIEVSAFILENIPEINLDNITGHEFIAPGRKQDPGPAFPWEKIKSKLSQWLEVKNNY